MHTLEEVKRFLRFYDAQGLTVEQMIQVMEYDGIPRVSNFPESISGAQRVPQEA